MTEEKDFKPLMDLVTAEEAGRNLASIIVAFRDEMRKEVKHGLTVEDVNELTLCFGQAMMLKLVSDTEMPEEGNDESNSTD